ncbi:hypothetical protein OGAPHI_002447 [Ogataea philodendri]|uniref:Rad50/SbcC-type AAA domain-containing protein n=2 Tax=Saccharomycotina TaxID=147537 RepID=A0A9P8PAI9_9ASCO|nr:uncharacterized protein OGAPHI_002447 [Ogataea philodendri]KAH3668693.1 hypothetical protein OGAPHI_002447 [Ogataea philodendri]
MNVSLALFQVRSKLFLVDASIPPEWISIWDPTKSEAITEHSMCHPGRPCPQGDGHDGSPALEAFHKAKSDAFCLPFAADNEPSPSAISSMLPLDHGCSLAYSWAGSLSNLATLKYTDPSGVAYAHVLVELAFPVRRARFEDLWVGNCGSELLVEFRNKNVLDVGEERFQVGSVLQLVGCGNGGLHMHRQFGLLHTQSCQIQGLGPVNKRARPVPFGDVFRDVLLQGGGHVLLELGRDLGMGLLVLGKQILLSGLDDDLVIDICHVLDKSNVVAKIVLHDSSVDVDGDIISGVAHVAGVINGGTTARPLTLIVGTNGSGKTTIIEALRYATTGDLPPNSKNGAFVNDPGMTGVTETKAQVKLAFQNVNQTNMVLTKSLAAFKNSRTKNTSFKTRENQLVAVHNGEKQTVTSKMADIEVAVPQQLGVSRAVLNYVIFCHQDDSLWPISDSANLKKKFDEIFDSVKFIKVLETFKVIQKEMNVDIKVLNNSVDHLRNDRNRAHNKTAQIDELNRQVDQLNMESDSLSKEIETVNREAEKLFTSNQDYEKTINRLEYLKQQEVSLGQQIDMIRTTTKPVSGSMDDIRLQLDNFANILVEKKSEIDQLKSQLETRSLDLETKRENYNSSVLESGRYAGLWEQYERNLAEIQRLEAGFDQKRLASLTALFEDKQSHFKTVVEDIEFEATTVKEELAKELQHAEYVRKDIASLEAKKSELERVLASSSTNQTKLQNERTLLVQDEKELEDYRQQRVLATVNEKISQTEAQIRQVEVKQEDLFRKVGQTSRQSDAMAKMHYLKKSLEGIEEKLESAFGRLGTNSVEQFTSSYETIKLEYSQLEEELKSEQHALSELKNSHQVHLQRSQESSEQIAVLEKEITTVLGATPIDQYDEVLEDAEYEFNDCDGGVKVREYCINFNKRAIDLVNHKNACLLCHREFGVSDEKSKVLELLSKQTSILENNKSAEDALKAARKRLETVKGVAGKVEEYRKLKNREDGVLKLVEEFALKTEKQAAIVSAKSVQIEEKRGVKSQFDALISTVDEIARLESEKSVIEKQLTSFKSELSVYGEELQSMEELEIAQSDANSEVRRLRLVLEHLKAEREQSSRKLATLEGQIKDRKLVIMELEKSDLDNVNVQNSLREVTVEVQQLRDSVIEKEKLISQLKTSQEELLQKLQTTNDQSRQELDSILPEIERQKTIQRDIESLRTVVREFEEKYPKKVSFEDLTLELKEGIKNEEVAIKQLADQLRTLEHAVSDADNEERNLRYNLDLISLETQQAETRATIAELSQQQAESKRQEFVSRSRELQARQSELQNQYSTKLGEMTQLSRQIQSVKQELARDYKDVDQKYTKEYANLQTKLSMVTDLSTYYKAIDNAVIEYHQVKMKEINRIVDELWKKTYMGNDVDTIMVKADPIKSTGSSLTRSYNYRVVMVKNGTELDMRGRCSAGQRVLAALIIRLALAECFGLNFGMIALDEPTTNLDDENIESLAKALSNIIQERASQKNFQLIVITHDEKFLRYMNAVDFTDHYYKIIRNERLNSTINRVEISQLDD